MITVIAHYTAAAGAADAVRQLLARHAAASRDEPGCLQFDAHQGIDNPDEFALVERYESQAAFAEHRRTPHFRRNVETELVALLTARSWNRMTTRYAVPNTPRDSTTAKGGNCRCTD
jgi:quinol monooxygenase YgiN